MDDLISRAAAKFQACNWSVKPNDVIFDSIKKAIKTQLDMVPAVDAVPVVRCKDCKFGKLYLDADGHSLIQCTNTEYPTANVETWPLELDWYCAGGERRDGDT